MSRTRRATLAVAAVALLSAFASLTPAQTPDVAEDAPVADKPAARCNDCTCVVHPLGALADDPKFGTWVVETIPSMIQPGTWNSPADQASARRRITYYAPAKVLVVCHTPAVQAAIKTFLADMHKATAAKRTPMTDRHVVPVRFAEAKPLEPTPGARGGYPIPMPEKQPKHLFHLILRYEGDGLDSAALTGLMSQLGTVEATKDGEKTTPDASKGSPLGQLLHFIVRYEGEGIIDSNVASLLRDIYGANAGGTGPRSFTAPATGSAAYPANVQPYVGPVNAPSSSSTVPYGYGPPVAVPPAAPAPAPGTAPAPNSAPPSIEPGTGTITPARNKAQEPPPQPR